MQRRGIKLNVNFNNVKETEATGKYIVEFNNQKVTYTREDAYLSLILYFIFMKMSI